MATLEITRRATAFYRLKPLLCTSIRPIHQVRICMAFELSRRDQLIKEKGYFHEMVELNKTGGKLFLANDELIRPSEATIFPNLCGDSLLSDGGELVMPDASVGKVSLVALSFKQYGYEQIETWMKPLQEKLNEIPTVNNPEKKIYKNNNKSSKRNQRNKNNDQSDQTVKTMEKTPFQIMYFSLTEGGMLAKLLKGSMKAGLIKNVPECHHHSSLIYIGDLDHFCEALKLDNRLVGHLFLLDDKANVRWHACGDVTDEEVSNLANFIRELQR